MPLKDTPGTPSGPAITLSAAVNAALLQGRKGAFRDGYTPEDADKVLGAVKDATGIDLSIIWAEHDEDGFHGDSEFAVYFGGQLRAIDDGVEPLSRFLWGRGAAPRTVTLQLGEVIDYECDNGRCSYARRDSVRPSHQ